MSSPDDDESPPQLPSSRLPKFEPPRYKNIVDQIAECERIVESLPVPRELSELDYYTPKEEEEEKNYNAAINEVNRWKDVKFFIEFVCSKIILEYSEATYTKSTPLEEYYEAFQNFCKEKQKIPLYSGAELRKLSDLLESLSLKKGTTATLMGQPKVVDLIRQALLVEHPDYPDSKEKINMFKKKILGDIQIGGRRRRSNKRKQTTKRRRSNKRRRTHRRK